MNRTIELIMKDRTKSLKKALEGVMSKSNYYRFINNDTDISLSKFIKLIKYNDISVKELFFISNNYSFIDTSTNKLNIVINSYRRKDHKKLEQIIHDMHLKKNKMSYKETYILYLSEVYFELLSSNFKNKKKIRLIMSFFYEIEKLSYFDILFLSNTMNIYSYEFNDYMFKKIMKESDNYYNYEKNENIFVNLIVARISYLIEIKELKDVYIYLKIINQIRVSNNQIFEKLCIKFLNVIFDGSNEPMKNKVKAIYFINILKELEDERYLLLESIIHLLEEKKIGEEE